MTSNNSKNATTTTPIDFAKEFGVTRRTVQQWCATGAIRAMRLPKGNYRIPISEIERIRASTGLLTKHSAELSKGASGGHSFTLALDEIESVGKAVTLRFSAESLEAIQRIGAITLSPESLELIRKAGSVSTK